MVATGYETASDSEAENVIDSLEILSRLFISLYLKKRREMEQELNQSHTQIE